MSGFEDALGFLCSNHRQLVALYLTSWVGIAGSVLPLVLADIGPGARVVAVLNLAGMVPLMLVSGGVLLLCFRR